MKSTSIYVSAILLATVSLVTAQAQTVPSNKTNTNDNTIYRPFKAQTASKTKAASRPRVKRMVAKLPPSFDPDAESAKAYRPSESVRSSGQEREGSEGPDRTTQHRGDWTFQFGQFPYFSFYVWTPPIANQPRPYGMNYW